MDDLVGNDLIEKMVDELKIDDWVDELIGELTDVLVEHGIYTTNEMVKECMKESMKKMEEEDNRWG